MNAVFHVLAVLGLGALLWFYLQAKATSHRLLEWARDGGKMTSRVRVDHPEHFMKKLGHTLQIPVEIQVKKPEPLRPMRGGGMMALMLEFGLKSIHWRAPGDHAPERLEVRTCRPVTEGDRWVERLSQELGCVKGAELLFTL